MTSNEPDSDDRSRRSTLRAVGLAAVLNFHRHLPTDPYCTDRPLESLDWNTVTDVKADAHRWLNWSRFGSGQPQESWLVEVDGRTVDGEPTYRLLERFNGGRLDGLDCDCRPTGGPDLPAGGSRGDGDVEGGSATPW